MASQQTITANVELRTTEGWTRGATDPSCGRAVKARLPIANPRRFPARPSPMFALTLFITNLSNSQTITEIELQTSRSRLYSRYI